MVEVYQSDVVTSVGSVGRVLSVNGSRTTTGILPFVVGLVVCFDIVVSLFMGRIYE